MYSSYSSSKNQCMDIVCTWRRKDVVNIYKQTIKSNFKAFSKSNKWWSFTRLNITSTINVQATKGKIKKKNCWWKESPTWTSNLSQWASLNNRDQVWNNRWTHFIREVFSIVAVAVSPFVNGRCHFRDMQKSFDLLLRVFLLKGEKIATQSRTRTPIFLPYHYTTTPNRRNSGKIININ